MYSFIVRKGVRTQRCRDTVNDKIEIVWVYTDRRKDVRYVCQDKNAVEGRAARQEGEKKPKKRFMVAVREDKEGGWCDRGSCRGQSEMGTGDWL